MAFAKFMQKSQEQNKFPSMNAFALWGILLWCATHRMKQKETNKKKKENNEQKWYAQQKVDNGTVDTTYTTAQAQAEYNADWFVIRKPNEKNKIKM